MRSYGYRVLSAREISPFTARAINRSTSDTTYSASDKRQKYVGFSMKLLRYGVKTKWMHQKQRGKKKSKNRHSIG